MINQTRIIFSCLGLISLLLGIAVYFFFRQMPPTIMHGLAFSSYSGTWSGSLPSLFHVFGFSMLTLAWLNAASIKHYKWIPFAWFFIAVILELFQYTSLSLPSVLHGTFDYWDILFSFFGMVLSLILLNWFSPLHQHPYKRLQFVIMLPVICLGVMSSAATSVVCDDNSTSNSACQFSSNATPVYMSLEELRQAVNTDNTVGIKQFGKIYRFENLLLVSERGKGIHIWNNNNPSKPNKITFINIPGNVDLAVKDGFLYADSFIDLVVIDINNLNRIREVNRIEATFPNNPYQAVPNWVRFDSIDYSQGVVVDYVLK